MKRLLPFVLLFAAPAVAQSNWGLAVDSRGAMTYCDLNGDQVWQRGADGSVRRLLDHTHCHTLYLGYDGNIYGEDIGAGSRASDAVSLWRITAAGSRSELFAPTSNPDPARWIAADAAGNTYAWNGDPTARAASQILKRSPAGAITVLAGDSWGYADGAGAVARFGNVAALAATRTGVVFVLEEGNLRRIARDGTVTTVVRGRFDRRTGTLPGHTGLWNHSVGIAVDEAENIYVADHYNGRWWKCARDGSVTLLARSGGIANALTRGSWGWMPTGVAVANDGVYIMDVWPLPGRLPAWVGSPRIRRIAPSGAIIGVVGGICPRLSAAAFTLLSSLTVALGFAFRPARRAKRKLAAGPC